MEDHKHDGAKCNCQPNTAVAQTLDEIDFERKIWSAALYNDIPKLEKFISNGHVNDQDNFGYTALHYAARSGHFAACQLLINNGANINAITSGGVTPLHRAVTMEHVNIIHLLLAKNVNLTIQDSDGQTVLHRAALKGNEEIIQLLNNQDASLKYVKDKKDQTPYDLIIEKFPNLKSIFNIK